MPVAIAQGDLLFEDTFTYADGYLSVVSDFSWGQGYWAGQPSLRVVSGQAAGPASVGWADDYQDLANIVSVASVGRDFIWRGITPTSPNTWTYCHFLGMPTGGDHPLGPNGYFLRFSTLSGRYYNVGRVTNGGSFTPIISTTTVPATGDDMAVRVMPDGTMSLWRKPSGGAWGQLSGNAVDNTYESGVLALESYETTPRWNAVEIRSVEAGGTTYEETGKGLIVPAARSIVISGRQGDTWAKAGSSVVGDH